MHKPYFLCYCVLQEELLESAEVTWWYFYFESIDRLAQYSFHILMHLHFLLSFNASNYCLSMRVGVWNSFLCLLFPSTSSFMFLLISLFNSTFFIFVSPYFSLYFSSFSLILILTLFSSVISVCFFFLLSLLLP